MKTVQYILAITFALSIHSLNAQEAKINGEITQTSADEVNVQLVKAADEKAKIQVRSEKGSILYRQTLKKHNRANIDYNIAQFPEGIYTFEICAHNQVIKAVEVTKGDNGIILLAEKSLP